MRPINRQAARVVKDSFYETFGIVRLGKKEEEENEARRLVIKKMRRKTFCLFGREYKVWWNLERFAKANKLDEEDPKTERDFLRISWNAEMDMRDIREAVMRGRVRKSSGGYDVEWKVERLRCKVRG